MSRCAKCGAQCVGIFCAFHDNEQADLDDFDKETCKKCGNYFDDCICEDKGETND